VNNEYQPLIKARTGALTEFRVSCVSAERFCAFQVLEGDGLLNTSTIIPFTRLASDGTSYLKPVYRRSNGNPVLPDVSSSEAYLSMAGGMRETVVVQFPRPGNYSIWQRVTAFDDDSNQLLMTVMVEGDDVEPKDITGYSLSSGKPLIPEDRPIDNYSGLTFGVEYDQEVYPFPYYGVGDINGENVTVSIYCSPGNRSVAFLLLAR
jgi:hypothetical protein